MMPIEDFALWLGAGFFGTLTLNVVALSGCWLFVWAKKFFY